MEPLLFHTLLAAALAVALAGFCAPGPGILRYPALFSVVVLGWVVPQLAAIRAATSGLEDSLATVHLMTLACLGGTVLGWRAGVAAALARFPLDRTRSSEEKSRQSQMLAHHLAARCGPHRADDARAALVRKKTPPPPSVAVLSGTAVVLTAVAGAMTVLIRGTGEGVGGMQTGLVTILLVFQNLKIVALFLSGYLALRYRSRLGLVLVALNILFYAPLVLLYFRRRAMIELLGCAALCLWFSRGMLVPRLVVLAAIPAGFVMMFAVGALRRLALGDNGWSYLTLSDLTSVDFLALTPLEGARTSPELLNAATIVRYAGEYGAFTLGSGTWDRLVFQWVPAQIVGADAKLALMSGDSLPALLRDAYGYTVRTGSTPTGIADAYLEFGYLGALFFVAIAFCLGRWWVRANRGDPWAAATYTAGLTLGLLTVTTYAFYFFNFMILYAGVLWGVRTGLCWLLPQEGRGQRRAAPRRAPPRRLVPARRGG